MKKVININFQGRIIPIEETAFEILKQYTESLRNYFAGEEGRDEIINDIENRIAELCSERLAHDTHCITDEDVNAIINTIGRPEELDEAAGSKQEEPAAKQANTGGNTHKEAGTGKFYRNSDDKILGGVCSGIANYINADPVLLRIIFVFLAGAIFWLYILIWLIVPARSLQTNITKRFYRNPEKKVLGGVCSGLAAYFHTEVWIPRLIFALPLASVLVSGTWDRMFDHWNFNNGWNLVSGSLGSSLLVTYIILWIAVPAAKSASDLLEMKGEKIDINSIRDKVKDNINQFHSKAEAMGHEMQGAASRISANTESGFVQFLKFGFKAIFFFIAGIVALVLLAVFIGLAFGGVAVFPLKNLLLEGTTQNTLAWCSLILVIGVPIIAIITWLIRRISGIRSGKSYIGTSFGVLWAAGFISTVILFSLVYDDLKVKHSEVTPVSMLQPKEGLITVTAAPHGPLQLYARRFWQDQDNENDWLAGIDKDSFVLKNVKVHVEQSPDSQYHMYEVRYSRGNSISKAQEQIQQIHFDIRQEGNKVILPPGIMISRKNKFRNQQVMVVIEVPLGKQIMFDESLEHYSWIVFRNGGKNFNIESEDDNDYHDYGLPYTMTVSGLKSTGDTSSIADQPGSRKLNHFSGLSLDLPVHVVLHTSDKSYVVIHAPENIVRKIHTNIKNDILHIESDNFGGNGSITIDVYSDRYETIEVNGSGNITASEALDLADVISIELNGSGNISLQGNCVTQQIELNGSGNINTREMSAKNAHFELTGSGVIKLNVSGEIDGNISGSGNVTNAGNAKGNVTVAGSGRFSKE